MKTGRYPARARATFCELLVPRRLDLIRAKLALMRAVRGPASRMLVRSRRPLHVLDDDARHRSTNERATDDLPVSAPQALHEFSRDQPPGTGCCEHDPFKLTRHLWSMIAHVRRLATLPRSGATVSSVSAAPFTILTAYYPHGAPAPKFRAALPPAARGPVRRT